MKRQTAESLVEAYRWLVELDNMELPDEALPKVVGLYDAVRDFLVLMLSDEAGEEACAALD